MKALGEVLVAVLGVALFLISSVLVMGTSTGIVREHCVDSSQTIETGAIDVDSSWTYILWPPLPFANLDPPGTCVRNSPLREGLNAVGIWDLPLPEDQVIEHGRSQLGD